MKIVYAGQDPNNIQAAVDAARNIDADDLANPRLRQERIGQAASIVSSFPEVRAALLEFQRNFVKSGKGAVLDGRDIGTVVCPEADFKFFITATLYARARRRHRPPVLGGRRRRHPLRHAGGSVRPRHPAATVGAEAGGGAGGDV